MSDRMADKVVESCRVYIEDVEGSLLDEAFQERLEELPEINGEEKAAYIEKNRELLKEHFVPAYEKLAEGLEALKGSGSNDLGIYYFPKGRKYYEYLVRNSIYPSFSTVDELRKAVEEQLEADINAIGIALRRSPELAENSVSILFSVRILKRFWKIYRRQLRRTIRSCRIVSIGLSMCLKAWRTV